VIADVTVLRLAFRLMPLAEAPIAELFAAFVADVYGDFVHNSLHFAILS
jgi:hypothetical protein